jgi:hypothetical protein
MDDGRRKTTDVNVTEISPSNELNSAHENDQKSLGEGEIPMEQPKWARIRHAFREPIAEFFGVFTLIIFGDGVVAQVVLSKGQKGDYQSINWGFLRTRSYMLML